MNKNILLIVGILFFVLIAWFAFQSKSTKQPVVETPPNKTTPTDPASKESTTVSQNDTQVFAGNTGGLNDAEKLTEGKWVWQATTENNKVLEPKDKAAFVLTFNSAEKMVNATTDCNSVFGPYTLGENNKLTFGDLGMTRKYCEGSQETDFAEGLGKVRSFSFDGAGALVLEFTADGDSMIFGKGD